MVDVVLWLTLCGITSIASGLWFYQHGFHAGTRAVKPRRYAPIALERIEQRVAELRTGSQDVDSLILSDLPHHGCPGVEQWLVLLQHQPVEAHTIIHQLYMHLYQVGVNAEIAAIMSIEAYHAAQSYLITNDPEIVMSRPVWQSYPTEAEWQQLVQTDPKRARRMVQLMELQRAHFGLSTPVALEESLETYHRIWRAVVSDGGPAQREPFHEHD